MGARSFVLQASLVLPVLLATANGCAKSDSVGDTFQNLGGSGGSGTGGEDQGGSGAGTTTDTGGTTSSSTSGSTTTGETTTSSSTTSSTTTEPTCSDGPDEGEPNNSEVTAHNLGTIGDNDGDGDSISGVLNGPGDVDWFRYSGQDDFGNTVDPSRTLEAMGSIRICKFVQCNSPPQDPYVCPGDSMPDTSPDGRLGCCSFSEVVYSATPFSAEEFDCTGSDDGAEIYIRVDNPNELACMPYTITYHF